MPVRLLSERNLIDGCTLYHGRGKDYEGENLIKTIVGNNYVGYDPADSPTRAFEHIHNSSFKTVLSIYVLNVLDPGARAKVIGEVWSYLRADGVAYFAVRSVGDRALKKSQHKWTKRWDGYLTGACTFQKFYTVKEIKRELSATFNNVKVIHGGDSSASIILSATR